MSSAKIKLTEEQVQDRLNAYSRLRSSEIRDEIVLQYANLVESVARRFTGAGEPLEDLVQEGYIGLISSVDLYDAGKGVKFSTYATHFIIGQIKHYLRDKGKIIKEPAWLQELNQKMSRVIDSLSQQMGRQPNETEIGQVMGIPEETVAEILTTREVFKVSSLDGGTDKDESSSSQVDPEKIKGQKLESFQLPLEDKIVLETAMDNLKSLDQKVIYEFYYQELNQTEIARKLGISCNYVSHILRNSTKKLKKILMTDEIRDTQMQMALMAKRLQDVNAQDQVSVIDALTGLYNVEYLKGRLDEEILRACRHNQEVSVVMVEVKLPETMSAYTRMIRNDDVLRKTADTIKNSVRKVDIVGRLGDNILAVILPHTGQNAGVVRDRLQAKITSMTVESDHREKLHLGVNVGFAVYPNDGSNASTLFDAALAAAGITREEELDKAA